MKLRQQPEDFIVDEVAAFPPNPKGQWWVYRVTKRSLATFEVMEVLRRALRLSRRDVSACGLKDKHAIATQFIALRGPIPASFQHPALSFQFAGKSEHPLNPGHIEGNRFKIAARKLHPRELEYLPENLDGLQRYGAPNYYDSQRFGAGGASHEFPGRALLLGNFEEAMRLHLAVARRKQSAFDKRIRKECAKYWGEWPRLLKKLPKSTERSIIAYLADHPTDFSGAWERIDRKLTGLYLAAYQSRLFNLALARYVELLIPNERLCAAAYKGGRLPFWLSLTDAELARLRELQMPLLNHRSDIEQLQAKDGLAAQAVLETCQRESLEVSQLKVRGLDSAYLYGSERRALLEPAELEVVGPEPDELNPGFECVRTAFKLPRGCFATIILKRLGLRRLQWEEGWGWLTGPSRVYSADAGSDSGDDAEADDGAADDDAAEASDAPTSG